MVDLSKKDGQSPYDCNCLRPQKKEVSTSGVVESVTYLVYTAIFFVSVIGGGVYLTVHDKFDWVVLLIGMILIESVHYSPAQWAALFGRNWSEDEDE